ncbi:hypothetical protein BOTBODRAFT_113023 [Botryobasidium botryosum FD-172 SS1]|uniref:Uncharacterized protein n=1 Tax=Botryobasidium botryosum (strain FD-172 SS1) TaxID=930990 RepID=A0A067MK98_BOTB1|nr:hypothetical protein BOTBODRAFT_113023 [Botryobasidium botryosum FD-172 SS1]
MEAALASRPGMRRKSSASNLLSFKSNPAPVPAVPANPASNVSPSSVFPTTANTMAKDWDTQSLFSDASTGTGSTAVPPPPTAAPPASLEAIRDMLGKRITALAHIKHAHEGKSHWLNTILLTSSELEKTLNNVTQRKRTFKFAVLGMSLSNLFDIHPPTEFLRALTNLLAEYDQFQDVNFRPKKRNLFRTSNRPRRAGGAGVNDFAAAYSDSGETSYLFSPNIPFSLDYFQVIFSFCEILTEVYQKIRAMIGGPSLFPLVSANVLGPPGSNFWMIPGPTAADPSQMRNDGMTSPVLSSGADSPGLGGPPSHLTFGSSGFGGPYIGGGLGSPPPIWSPVLGDSIIKIDGRFKKIIATLIKELDELAREAIKEELASLDPLLRNIMAPSAGNQMDILSFDFDV